MKLCSSFLPLPSADPADSLSVLLPAGNPSRAWNAVLEHGTPVAEDIDRSCIDHQIYTRANTDLFLTEARTGLISCGTWTSGKNAKLPAIDMEWPLGHNTKMSTWTQPLYPQGLLMDFSTCPEEHATGFSTLPIKPGVTSVQLGSISLTFPHAEWKECLH